MGDEITKADEMAGIIAYRWILTAQILDAYDDAGRW